LQNDLAEIDKGFWHRKNYAYDSDRRRGLSNTCMLPKLLINFSLTQKLFLTKTYVKSPFFIKLAILSLPNLSYNFLTELHTFLPINNFNKKNLPNISLKTFDNYTFILNSKG
jgi:hypothetical protein